MNRNPIHELSGVDELRLLRQRAGLPERDTEAICKRVADATRRAGMTPRAFRSMDRRAFRIFCASFNLVPAEVRLAQCMARLVRSMATIQALGARVRVARSQPNAGVRYQ